MISMVAAPKEAMDTKIMELIRKAWLSFARMDMLGWSRHWTLRLTSGPILNRSSGRKKCSFVNCQREKESQMNIVQVNNCNSKHHEIE